VSEENYFVRASMISRMSFSVSGLPATVMTLWTEACRCCMPVRTSSSAEQEAAFWAHASRTVLK